MTKRILWTAALLALVGAASAMAANKFDDELPSDTHIQEIVSSVGAAVQSISPRLFESIEVVSYRSHVVAGRNYLVKALLHRKNMSSKLVHLRIYKPIRGRSELIALLDNVDLDSPLEYFE